MIMRVNEVRQYLKIDEKRKKWIESLKEKESPFITYEQVKISEEKRLIKIKDPIELILDTIRFIEFNNKYELVKYTMIHNDTDAIIQFNKIERLEDSFED